MSQVQAVEKLQAMLADGSLVLDGMWAVYACPIGEPDSAQRDRLGQPGPWKELGGGRIRRKVFEIPLCVLDEIGADDEDDNGTSARLRGLRQTVEWARATADGNVPAGWSPPPAKQLAAWVKPELLTVQCDGNAITGRIISTDNRLSIAFPILLHIPPALPEHRRQRLVELCDDAHFSFRMVRAGLRGGGRGRGGEELSAIAEVDLTGAPAPAIESLLRYAAEALRHIVRWAGPAANLIVSDKRCPLIDP